MCACLRALSAEWRRYNWVEARTYGGYYPNPLIPIPACLHDTDDPDAEDAACNACKGAIDVGGDSKRAHVTALCAHVTLCDVCAGEAQEA